MWLWITELLVEGPKLASEPEGRRVRRRRRGTRPSPDRRTARLDRRHRPARLCPLGRSLRSEASACSRRRGTAQCKDPLFDGRIDVVEGEGLVDRAGLDGFGRHAEDHGCSFILRDDQSAGGLDGFRAGRSVVAHARENRANAHGAGEGGNAFHSDINIGEIAVDAAGSCVELDAAGRRDAQMLAARTNVEGAWLQRFVGYLPNIDVTM